jgi:glycine betaine/choline ABC-type transport system substrate-binding protein
MGGTMLCHGALVEGEIDLYAEYTGTALLAVLGEPADTDAAQVLETVDREYRRRFRCQWLTPFGFDNSYAITVRARDAAENGWETVSDLKGAAAGLRAGFTSEFMERPDGYPGLRRAYAIDFGKVQDLEPALMYQAIAKSEIDVICAFATDGRIAAYDLKALKDDRKFFPPYQAAPVVRSQILEAHPALREALDSLGGVLADSTMRRLNYLVDGEGLSPAAVARAFLAQHSLL